MPSSKPFQTDPRRIARHSRRKLSCFESRAGTRGVTRTRSRRRPALVGSFRLHTPRVRFDRPHFRVLQHPCGGVHDRFAMHVLILRWILHQRQLKRSWRVTRNGRAAGFEASRVLLEHVNLRVHHLDEDGIIGGAGAPVDLLAKCSNRFGGNECDEREAMCRSKACPQPHPARRPRGNAAMISAAHGRTSPGLCIAASCTCSAVATTAMAGPAVA